jgi:hypothetical protein
MLPLILLIASYVSRPSHLSHLRIPPPDLHQTTTLRIFIIPQTVFQTATPKPLYWPIPPTPYPLPHIPPQRVADPGLLLSDQRSGASSLAGESAVSYDLAFTPGCIAQCLDAPVSPPLHMPYKSTLFASATGVPDPPPISSVRGNYMVIRFRRSADVPCHTRVRCGRRLLRRQRSQLPEQSQK